MTCSYFDNVIKPRFHIQIHKHVCIDVHKLRQHDKSKYLRQKYQKPHIPVVCIFPYRLSGYNTLKCILKINSRLIPLLQQLCHVYKCRAKYHCKPNLHKWEIGTAYQRYQQMPTKNKQLGQCMHPLALGETSTIGEIDIYICITVYTDLRICSHYHGCMQHNISDFCQMLLDSTYLAYILFCGWGDDQEDGYSE